MNCSSLNVGLALRFPSLEEVQGEICPKFTHIYKFVDLLTALLTHRCLQYESLITTRTVQISGTKTNKDIFSIGAKKLTKKKVSVRSCIVEFKTKTKGNE